MLIDTHYHSSPHWFEPVEVFIFHMNRCGIDKGVIVQHRGEFDNRYIIEAARLYPGRISPICLVDYQAPDAAQKMEHWAAQGAEGFRFWQDEKIPGKDPLVYFRKANELKMLVSTPGTTDEYASEHFENIVKSFPNMPIIIEHMAVHGRLVLGGGGSDKGVPVPPYTTFRKVLALSKYPNLFIKITGFGEVLNRPAVFNGASFDLSKMPPLFDMCLETFGASRMMVGTDPTSSNREGYGNVWKYVKEYIKKFTPAQQEMILGKTAAGLFPFRGGKPA